MIEEKTMQTKYLLRAFLLLPLSLTAQAQNTGATDRPTFDVFGVINRLADQMDREFIVDPRLGGEYLGWSTSGATADYDTLLAVLRTAGFAAIEVGNEIRIVSEQTARAEPSLVLNEDDSRVSDHAIVTRVIDVADLETTLPDGTSTSGAAQLVPVLRPMMSTNIGNITSIPGTHKLVVVDRYDNIRRITAIIDELRE